MLEFIVLGLIPGTHVQLEFADVIMAWVSIMFALHVLRTMFNHYRLVRQYEQSALYFTIVARKHWLTRQLHS